MADENWEKWIIQEIRASGGDPGQLYDDHGYLQIDLAIDRLYKLKGMEDAKEALRISKEAKDLAQDQGKLAKWALAVALLAAGISLGALLLPD